MRPLPLIRRVVGLLVFSLLMQVLASTTALAYDFDRTLREGSRGRDVRALQIRIAGWFPAGDQNLFDVDGSFDADTKSSSGSRRIMA